MGQSPRDRGAENLVGLGGHGHGRGNAGENQERRHKKAAADAEQTRQRAHEPTQAQKVKDVNGNLGNREVDLHQARPRRKWRHSGKPARPQWRRLILSGPEPMAAPIAPHI